MKIDLKKYLNDRDAIEELKKAEGPVVTLSRQYGCGSNKIVLKLLGKIESFNEDKIGRTPWNYISKEIIDESARELKLTSNRLEDRVIAHGKSVVSDIFSGLSHHYSLSDKKIIKTIKEIIETYAKVGHVIVVGGVAHH